MCIRDRERPAGFGASGVETKMLPVGLVAEDPEDTKTEPPLPALCPVPPADIVMSPPVPALPWPTVISMAPPPPLSEAPVPILIGPLVPPGEYAAPVLSVSIPEAEYGAALLPSFVLKCKMPELSLIHISEPTRPY